MFSGAICGDMRFGNLTNGQGMMHDLQDSICVRIQNMCLEATVLCLVVEAKGKKN